MVVVVLSVGTKDADGSLRSLSEGRRAMKRPRLSRGQMRLLTHLAYLTHRAIYARESWPALDFECGGYPVRALLRHGYLFRDGAGYKITASGLMRAKRAYMATGMPRYMGVRVLAEARVVVAGIGNEQ